MNVWHQAKNIIESGHSLYLLTVIDSQGSAPGRRGFKMLVSGDQQLFGSIGGGIMEYKLVEKAKSYLSKKNHHSQIIEQIHRGDAWASSGMICSGSQTIALTPLSSKDLSTINSIIDGTQGLQINQNGLLALKSIAADSCQMSPEKWCYQELLNKQKVVHIFGAGHVSLSLSHLLSTLGFSLQLYDNRQNLNTYNHNDLVESKQIIDYQNIDQYVAINKNDYVLLMTHKFTEDKLILTQLLNKNIKYLGVLGSENKIKIMFTQLLKQGFSADQLSAVKAPIGLDINSRTTEEIAVSIAAEMIRIKNV